MALSDQFPDLYNQWVAAGGITDNFRAHVIATNPSGYTMSADDLAFMVGHTNGAFNQLNLATATYEKAVPAIAYKAVVVGQPPGP